MRLVVTAAVASLAVATASIRQPEKTSATAAADSAANDNAALAMKR